MAIMLTSKYRNTLICLLDLELMRIYLLKLKLGLLIDILKSFMNLKMKLNWGASDSLPVWMKSASYEYKMS